MAVSTDLLSGDFVRKLHKHMFGETWRWAGSFRSTEKNIGIDPVRIAPASHDLCADLKTRLAAKGYMPKNG